MSNEESTEVAQKWMDIADLDGSGTIDAGEFKEMISKLDESIAADEVNKIFESKDENGSGELSVENFGQALYDCLVLMKPDENGD